MSAVVFLAALLAPFLFACTNHIDKILLEGYFKQGGVGTLMLVSALLSVVVVPVTLFLDPAVLDIEPKVALVLIAVAFLNVLLLWCYLQAMHDDEPTVVIVFYSFVPVAAVVMAWVILGEMILPVQFLGMGLVIAGALVMSITAANHKLTIKKRSLGYMVVASLCWAGEATLFKWAAIEEDLVRSFFWEYLAMTVFGVILYTSVRSYRESFHAALRENSFAVLSLNALNEFLYIAGSLISAAVVMQIPVALNLLMQSFQPLFVFAIGVGIRMLWPKLATEAGGHASQKIFAIVLCAAGMYFVG